MLEWGTRASLWAAAVCSNGGISSRDAIDDRDSDSDSETGRTGKRKRECGDTTQVHRLWSALHRGNRSSVSSGIVWWDPMCCWCNGDVDGNNNSSSSSSNNNNSNSNTRHGKEWCVENGARAGTRWVVWSGGNAVNGITEISAWMNGCGWMMAVEVLP